MKAKLHTKEEATPSSSSLNLCHSHHALPTVVHELEKMENEEIIEQVDFSEWVPPLVCVPNQIILYAHVLDVDEHPTLTLEQAFGNWAQGE